MYNKNNSNPLSHLDQNANNSTSFFDNRILNVKEAAKVLDVSVGHIYNLVSSKMIPHRKKRGKLYFFIEELIDWINEGD